MIENTIDKSHKNLQDFLRKKEKCSLPQASFLIKEYAIVFVRNKIPSYLEMQS